MSDFFYSIYKYFLKRPKTFILTLLLFLSACSVSLFGLSFEENFYSFFPKNAHFEKVSTFLQNSPLIEKIIINISLNDGAEADPDLLADAAGEFSAILKERYQPEYIKAINDTVSQEKMAVIHSVFYNNIPLFLTDDDYRDIESRLNRKGIDRSVENCYKMLMTPGSMVMKEYMMKDPLGISFMAMRQMQAMQIDENYHLYSNYIFSKDDRNLLIFINPAYPSNKTAENIKFFKLLDTEINELVKKYNNKISIGYYGVPVISADNALQIQKDIYLTVTITLIIIFLIVFFVIREKRMLLVIMVPVLFGFAFSIGMLALIKGSVSMISFGIGSVLIGIMIDYAIHVSTHFRSMHSMRSKFKETVYPIIMCLATNVSAFLCLYLVNSDMLKDLSLFAVFNMIGAAFFAILIVPHFYRYSELKKHKEYRYRNNKVLKWFFSHTFEKNRTLMLAIIAVTIACMFFVTDVEFEDDLSNLSYTSPRAAEFEKKFNTFDKIKQKSIMLISESGDLSTALEKNGQIFNTVQSLKENGVVEKIISVSSLIKSPSEQDQKIKKWEEFWTKERVSSVRNMLESSGRSHSFKPGAFSEFYGTLEKEYQQLSSEDFRSLSGAVFSDIASDKDGKIQFVTILKADRGKIKEFYSAYENNKDVFSDVIVADKQYLTNRFIESIKDDFNTLSILDSVVIFAILLIFLGRFELAAISFIPIALSWIWILGLMGFAGIKFNIFNIIISSIIFGLGVDYSIIMIQGLIHQYRYGGHGLEASRESIFFSALTNITGMGVLFFAKHPALKSIALISSIGILSVYIISNIIPPFLFKILVKARHSVRPLKFSAIFSAVIIYSLFTAGVLVMTVIAVCLKLLPVPERIKRKLLTLLIMLLCRLIQHYSFIFPFYSKVIIDNRYGEKFDKPGIIISNHQSLLDIVFLLSLSPKTTVMVKDWVWKSPLLGIVVRIAGYLPVSKGIEQSIDKIRERADEGYSVLVFPEGERSADMEIKRFHKGAFFISEKLNLDIIPVIIHGTGHIVRKNTLSIYPGSALVTIDKRIPVNNGEYGSGYSDKTKAVRKIFEERFAEIRLSRENTSYFADFIIDKYIYKDPVTEWYMRVKLKLENNYEFFNSVIPRKASVVDLGCGYGFLSFMLALCSDERKVIGVDYDKDKISVAENISIPGADIRFEYADITEFALPRSDVFIMSDMLHYMPEDKQVELITRCMSNLSDGGMIIIRDANKDLSERHFYTKLSEILSTRIKFNKVKYDKMFFVSRTLILSTAENNGFSCTIHDRSKKTSNEIYILRRI